MMTDAEYETRGRLVSVYLNAPLDGVAVCWFNKLPYIYEQAMTGDVFCSRAAAYRELGKADDLIRRACGYYELEKVYWAERESGPASTLPPGDRAVGVVETLGERGGGRGSEQTDR